VFPARNYRMTAEVANESLLFQSSANS
jgi:hypothetical protein